MNTCRNCYYWRDKAWDANDEGIGICDNPTTIKQVTMMSEVMIIRLSSASPSEAKAIANSIRFSSEFGCNNFKQDNT
jgi:hypothetical protein